MSIFKFPIEDLEKIKLLIPHREPMILISSILSASENEVVSSLLIKENSVFLDKDLFSEAGIIENMAQTAACLEGLKKNSVTSPTIGYLVSVNNLKIISLPKTKYTINTMAERTFSFNGLSKFKIDVMHNGQLIAQSELTTAIEDLNR
ncbi:hypothetical protein [Aegicerativicinus sediminis]|uniref:hypothetical protein n=1 Tax=Aegicerativicinus sediminis TaxID=2893202 RepID=UPI001E4A7941|nr:hypothetical protein [Aegicerativicinus sediminis]